MNTCSRFALAAILAALCACAASKPAPPSTPTGQENAVSGQATQEERNKALVREATEEFLVKRNVEAVDRYFAPDYIQHNPHAPPGPAGVKQFFSALFTALPDLEVRILHIYAEGDRVFSFMTWEGTHQAPFFGVPASGQRVIIRTAEIFRIEDGRMAEHWDVVDDSDMKRKAGLLPAE
jgi:steroid delta-isomerase-like uncharacterized protein